MLNLKIYIGLLFALLPMLMSSETLYVDDDYTSTTPGWGTTHFNEIQDAIDEYSTGDTVFVYPGTYYEAINNYSSGTYIPVIIRSKYTVSGYWEDVENTIINATGLNGTAVSFYRNTGMVNFDVELNGFTVMNGSRGIQANGVNADILNCIVDQNSSNQDGGGLYTLNGSYSNIENCVFKNNSADNGGGIYSTNSSVVIDNCEFYANEATGGKGGAICFDYSANSCKDLTISRSLFYENTADDYGGAIYYPGCASATLPELEIDFTTFADNEVTTGNGAKGIDLGSDGHDNYKSILIENSIIVEASPNISTSTRNCDINYSCIKNGCDNPNADLYNCITSDPDFVSAANDDYSLEYSSPCIDAGDGSSACNDPDGSRADMGYLYHEQDIYTWQFGLLGRTYIWKSFPKLQFPPNVTNHGQGIDVDEAWESWQPVPEGLYAWYELEGANNEFEIGDYDAGWHWTNGEEIKSICGYKLKKDNGSGCLMFSRGLKCLDNTVMISEAGETVWLGYFLEESQLVLDAIPSVVRNDAIMIKTMDWSISRPDTDSRWSGSPESCYLHYADCVLLTTVDEDHEFRWETPTRSSESEPRPVAEHFTFSDDIDYIPVYVEFDENDIPDEVAIYVNDVCRGAQVVEDTICQICSYILEEEQGQEIEFAFWYEGRNSVVRQDNYMVLNQENGKYESRSLITGMPGIHYEVSFKEPANEIVHPQYDLNCYPNPFNPELTISFSTRESTEYTEITIFNVKGQKVKTLVSELFRPDDYIIVWKGDDNAGNKVSSGVYYIRLQVGDNIVNRKVILMK